MSRILALALLATGSIASVGAQTLNAAMTVDNAFTAYVSQSSTTLGTQFLTGNSWPTTYFGSTALAPGANYITVFAVDGAQPAMFIADLDVTGGTFAIGGTELLTGSAGWTVSGSGFNGTYGPTFDLGPNGTGPWGNFGAISPAARFVWNSPYNADLYFRTVVNVPVPEPASLAALGVGAIALIRRRRR